MRVPGGRRALALVAVPLVLASVAACGDDDDGTSAAAPESSGTTGGPDLTGVCPDPLIVQTDWFPEPEHGGLYQLIGTDGERSVHQENAEKLREVIAQFC